jgi:hypothetical protein
VSKFRFSNVCALTAGVGLAVGLGMVVPSLASASPPQPTIQRIRTWDNYFTDRYPPVFTLHAEIDPRSIGDIPTVDGIPLIDIPLPPSDQPQVLLIWTTFEMTDAECDISTIMERVSSAPPGTPQPFPGGMSAGPLDGPPLGCGGPEMVLNGVPYIWAGTAGNYFVSVPGQYRIFNEIFDATGALASNSLAINVIAPNSPPVATIAPIGPVHPGAPVILDGSQSFDPDIDTGDGITAYEWTITRISPPPSEVIGTPVGPFVPFVFPTSGIYDVTLVVRDSRGGESSTTVQASTFNAGPVADAGLDISLAAPTSVVLPCYTLPCDVPQGNRSYDPDGDNITYRWVRIDASGAETIVSDMPTISPPVDVNVAYRLEVRDPFGLMSFDEVIISFNTNRPPHASFSMEAVREVGEYIEFDARHSSDPDGDPLTYLWMLTSVPAGSAAVFDDPTSRTPSFFADRQ